MFGIDIDDARSGWLNQLRFEDLLDKEGLADLSWSGDQNSGRMTESDHDRELIVILIGFEIVT